MAKAVPENVVVFFLPVRTSDKITSVQEAVPSKMPNGEIKEIGTERFSEKNPDHEIHGIPTRVGGTSLYDKGGIPLNEATERIVVPAKVLILPPENLRKKSTSFRKKVYESILPGQVRVFPLVNPAEDIRWAVKERVKPRYEKLKPPEVEDHQRPSEMEDWTQWVLKELKNCNMDAKTVLPTLYWLSVHQELNNKTSCEMKNAVAAYLRMCHPWPVVYYTPVNNDVPVRPAVQMAAEYLEATFEQTACPALDLTGVNFERTDFIAGNLRNADFSNSYFHEATFDQTDLSDTVFKGALMDNVLFRDVALPRAVFDKARLKDSHFHRMNASGTKFISADLQNAQFRDVFLSHSDFGDSILQNTGWEDVRAYRLFAPNADFTMAGFDNVILEQMYAPKAVFEKIVCKTCVLKESFLDKAYFYDSFFENTFFDRARLNGADFRAAVFEKSISFDNASLYQTKFGETDLRQVAGLSIEQMTKAKPDRETLYPEKVDASDPESYDEEADGGKIQKMKSVDRYSCTKRVCEDRLLGRVSNQTLAVRAMTVLSNPQESLDNRIWAVCTIGCIAKQDNRLENSQADILAAFVRKQRPWDAEKDLFKPYTRIPLDVQMALYVLTDKDVERDLGHDIDLTRTDLRTADLSDGDLRNIDFAGSYLGGADLLNSDIDNTYAHFDRVVIDEFIKLPDTMKLFEPFRLPEPETPPWWKPETVRVYRDGTHYWTVTTDDIPFSDDLIAKPEENGGSEE